MPIHETPKDGAWPSSIPADRAADTLEWAVLAPMDAAALDAFVVAHDPVRRWPTWWVVPGSEEHAAAVCAEPGTETFDSDLAEALAKHTGQPCFVLGLSGWLDPDHGAPSIRRVHRGRSRELWSSVSLDEAIELVTMFADDPDEASKLIAQQKRLYQEHDPSITDPWQHAASLGIRLPRAVRSGG